MKDKETENNVFDILDKIEFFQGQRAGRELWNDKPKEVQDKDIADFIKDINYIRSYLQDSVVLSREELSEEPYNDFCKGCPNVRVRSSGMTDCCADYSCEQFQKYARLLELYKQIRKETAEKILKDFKLWAREYQYKDTVIDENGERPMTSNEKLNYLYIYLCDKYKVEIKE